MTLSPALRKAAILISALDEQAADRLLDQMGADQAARVRAAVVQLDDVDPVEEESILAEFFGRPAAQPAQDAGVELEVSAASLQAAGRAAASVPESKSLPRFHLLHAASSGELAQRLRGEHPQLIALVAAYLPAEKSAEFLENLPAALQDDVIERLHQLDDADAEVVAQLEHELERLFAHTQRQAARSGPHQDHLQAILGILRRKSQQKETEQQSSKRAERIVTQPAPNLRREPDQTADQWQTVAVESPRTSPKPAARVAPPTIAFEQLLSLPAHDFFAVFDEADPRVVMLALAGAPRRLFERYLAQFSSERALEFERHLEQLRPLRLRDVEAAQQELATLAGRRLASAKPAAESSRRFAAAA